MERMIIKHLSGSKANQVEEFALKHHNELSFGRDTSAVVQFDPDRDDLVGREHARIERDPSNAEGFLLTDLNSTNGTFLNDKKITGTTQVRPGDVVQFGPGGPRFQFDVEPRPANATKATRMVNTDKNNAPATRVVDTAAAGSDSIVTKPATKASVGKATVERMISHNVAETRQEERGNFAKIGGLAAIAILLLFGAVIGGGYWYYSSQAAKTEAEIAKAKEEAAKTAKEEVAGVKKGIDEANASAPKAASEIADNFSDSVVQIEVAWRLINPVGKGQVYHRFIPSQVVAAIAKQSKQNFNTNAMAVPLYIQKGNTYQPVLVDDKSKAQYDQEIGGIHSGTGFVVTSDGFVLTNRHVAATWKTAYQFPQTTPPGVVINPQGQILSFNARPPGDWIPANSKGQDGALSIFNTRIQSPADYTGVNDRLEVAFAGKDRRMNSQLIEASDRHDVALMKVDKPGELKKVELFDNYDELKKGEEVIVMGYPVMTARQFGVVNSGDMFNDKSQVKTIANPTVTLTSVSNIMRSSKRTDEKVVVSEIGDVIQLATGSTGGGNSGGPVFDTQGRVIGIFFAGSRVNDIRYAIPIRYGKELME